jgi:DNA-binding MarR family transcriptional regulator
LQSQGATPPIFLSSCRREPDGENRRIHLLHLTQRGLALEKKVSDMQKNLLRRAFRSVGDNKEEGWRQVMSKLAGFDLSQAD